ncbi:hypothetical protein [Longimicrobium sp.]|jgi:hypothetical protein|uniref:hypothetical protein n=1 Tax=Longimicrobium sp. TaxID=2029185 RepID=UPI002F945CA9
MRDPGEGRVQITRVGSLHVLQGMPLLPAGFGALLRLGGPSRMRFRVEAGAPAPTHEWQAGRRGRA